VDELRPELCIHLAWYAEPGSYLDSLVNLDMLSAALMLAGRLSERGCRRLVGVGTCFEYDLDYGNLSESSPLQPRSLYAACKASLGNVLERLSSTTGMEAVWVRPFYLYGPFEDERRLVPSVVRSLLREEEVRATAGAQVRDYLHVEDVASAIWAVAQSELCGPVNIGSGQPVTVREILSRIGGITGNREMIKFGALPYRASDPLYVCADNRRLTEGTPWAARFSLEEGLRDAVEWWRNRSAR
jgi:nucleoside-diphosphate-sugar epimerase